MQPIHISTKISYKNIPKNINSSFAIMTMNNINPIIWYLPIKIGRRFYLLCTINSDSTFSFYHMRSSSEEIQYLDNIFFPSLSTRIMYSQLQFREFFKLLRGKVSIPIYDIKTREQLKQHIERFLVERIQYFFTLYDKNIYIRQEIHALQNEIWYISPKRKTAIEQEWQRCYQQLIS